MEQIELAVVGGGPAGLHAAEIAARAGCKVTVFEQKKSVGRKFLVAGKGGLNITHGEEFSKFRNRYSTGGDWEEILKQFDSHALREWCTSLGQETFQASSGRVYPKALKGAPVLRAWITRLRELGVIFALNEELVEIENGPVLHFRSGRKVRCQSAVLALGGASWPQTGSTGSWTNFLEKLNIQISPLIASNCGWQVKWSADFLAKAEGLPLKNIRARATGDWKVGELMVTRYGLEGGIIYALGRELRASKHPRILIDLKPTFSKEQLLEKVGQGAFDFKKAVRLWRLSAPAKALLESQKPSSFQSMVELVKSYSIDLMAPQPIAEAISSCGGIAWRELNDKFMLRQTPGIFVAGEMIDWDAPTGGYLLQGCFATGKCAGEAAANFAQNNKSARNE